MDPCEAADRIIDELESSIRDNAAQSSEERLLAQRFCIEQAEKADLYYNEAYKREQWVINLRSELKMPEKVGSHVA